MYSRPRHCFQAMQELSKSVAGCAANAHSSDNAVVVQDDVAGEVRQLHP